MIISEKFLFDMINMSGLKQKVIANIRIIDYPTENVEMRDYYSTVIAIANEHLFHSFSLLESGLLVKNRDKAFLTIEAGLDLAAEAETIFKLSSDKKLVQLNLFYTTFACQGKLIVREDYSIAIPETEMGSIAYRIEKFSNIIRATASSSKNHSQAF